MWCRWWEILFFGEKKIHLDIKPRGIQLLCPWYDTSGGLYWGCLDCEEQLGNWVRFEITIILWKELADIWNRHCEGLLKWTGFKLQQYWPVQNRFRQQGVCNNICKIRSKNQRRRKLIFSKCWPRPPPGGERMVTSVWLGETNVEPTQNPSMALDV